jgi:hypothetical protein
MFSNCIDMKRILLTLTSIILIAIHNCLPVYGQRFEAIPYLGYQTGGRIEAYEGSFKVTDGLSAGASLNYKFKEGYKVEVSYSRTASELDYTVNGNTQYLFDIAVHYISIGALAEINPGGRTVPFFKVGVGRTIYQPLADSVASENVMHFDVSGGAKFMFSQRVGIRLQASLLLPVFFEGIYFEEAAPPPGQGIKTELSGIQGNISAGVLFRF